MARAAKSIAIVAPACRLPEEAAVKVDALARGLYGDRVKLFFHPQCFLNSGHFAGEDAERSKAFLDVANDPAFDAVWFARGGYGACRLDDALFGKLNRAAHLKDYLGYSDIGFLLARLAREGVGRAVHGPMPSDINREGGEAAVERSLSWLVDRDSASLEPSWRAGAPAYAFNLTVLSNLLGTVGEPNFAGAVLMIEDVDEHHYRIDRTMFHVTSSENVRRSAGIRLGRVSKIPPNDPPFERTETEIVADWCARARIPFLGPADIGHDAANKVAPFPAALALTA
ncbi:MAG: LD-carboxypeptidase [Pseudomonadota bacterium]